MSPKLKTVYGWLFAGVFLASQAAATSWAQTPESAAGPRKAGEMIGPVPGLYVGSDSRGYPYYSGFRYYPAYPLYRAYPEYLGDPLYPRLSYAAGTQPSRPYLLAFFGLHPALWAFNDYYSGNYPSYYGRTPDYRGGPADSPSPTPLPPVTWPLYPPVGNGPDGLLQSSAPAAPVSAVVTVQAPADAEVWFDGRKMTTTGSVRQFHTPPLPAGSRYTYDVTARWEEGGRPKMQHQPVYVTAGSAADVTFTTNAAVADLPR